MGHREYLWIIYHGSYSDGLWTASPTSNITFHNSEVKWMEIQILKARAKIL